MRADWGVDVPYLSDRWPSQALRPDRLPGVLRARADGWYLTPDAPMWAFLPAVWPAAHRAWVPDRSVRLVRLERGGSTATIPWSAWDHVEAEDDVNDLLASAGLPPRPFGRLWLLRPPPGSPDLDAVLRALGVDAHAEGLPLVCDATFVAWTCAALDRWFADPAT